jgi:lysozyme
MLDLTKLQNEIKREEGEVKEGGRHVLYFDHLGKPTIGHGRILHPPGGITDAEADYLFMNDLQRLIDELDERMLWWRGESDMRKRALVNMSYQLGVNGLLSFKKMLWEMQHGMYKKAAAEALDSRWAKQTPERAKRIAKMIEQGYD